MELESTKESQEEHLIQEALGALSLTDQAPRQQQLPTQLQMPLQQHQQLGMGMDMPPGQEQLMTAQQRAEAEVNRRLLLQSRLRAMRAGAPDTSEQIDSEVLAGETGPGPGNPQDGQQQQENQLPGDTPGTDTALSTPDFDYFDNHLNLQPSQQQVPAAPPPDQNHLGMVMPSSLGVPDSGMDSNMSMFDPSGFINPMSDFGDFDAALFRLDGDINFERDFGQWFNPDEPGQGLGSGLDMQMPDDPLR